MQNETINLTAIYGTEFFAVCALGILDAAICQCMNSHYEAFPYLYMYM